MSAVKRGIYTNLIDSFGLLDLQDIKSRPDFVAALPGIARASKKYFHLSSQYFDSGAGGTVQVSVSLYVRILNAHLRLHEQVQLCLVYVYNVCTRACVGMYWSTS